MDCEPSALQEQASAAQACTVALKSVEAMLSESLGSGVAPTFGPLATLLQKIAAFLQAALARRVPAAEGETTSGAGMGSGPFPAGGSGSGEIRSREDVVRALERISGYYARHEPSSPIPLLVDRCNVW